MVIKKMYLGIWFQRTSIHLREIYQFLRYKKVVEELDLGDLDVLWKNMVVKSVNYSAEKSLDFVRARCGDYDLSLSEDGVVLVKMPNVSNGLEDVKKMENFYINNLGPMISYLFSRGAPLPKDLLNIKETYPVYLLVENISQKEISSLFSEFGDEFISSASTRGVELYSGEKIGIINIRQRKYNESVVEELIQNLVFFREFERQLSYYLHLHRNIWEKIRVIRDSENLYYNNIKEARDHLLDVLEILSFVKARLRQMKDILEGRDATLNLFTKKELAELGMERFEMFKADTNYMESLWQTTVDYANSTLGLMNSIFNENTQRELNALRFITLLGVIVGFFGMNIAFPWEDRWPLISSFSWSVLLFMVVVACISYYLLKIFLYRRKFSLHWHREEILGTKF